MNKLLSTTVISAFLAVTTASMAIAQSAPVANAPSASSPAHRFWEHPFSRPTERVEARLAHEKTALKITDAQQPQWNAYANFARKYAQDREQRFKSMQSDKQEHPKHQRSNAIERLEKAQTFLAEGVTRLNGLLAVEKPLYATLSPDQQKVADVMLNRHLRAMQRRMMHGHHGFGRG